MTFVPLDATRSVVFELNGSLKVETIEKDGKALTGYVQDPVGVGSLGPSVRIDLGEIVPANQPVTLRIRWSGALLSPEGGPAAVVSVTAILLVAVLAFGTLQFTVVAIATAPQVVGFLALTHFTAGLDRARRAVENTPASAPVGPVVGLDGRASYWAMQSPPPRFRWLTRSLLAGVALGVMALIGGILQIAGS